ncbi:MAG TPA: PPC domain-containing DNA-binding protein [Parafilimonas sp.]
MHYKLLNNDKQKTFAVVLNSDDEVMECIKFFANEQHLKASRFNAIGAFSTVTLGFFDFNIKDYKKINIDEQVEVLNIPGDISSYNNEIKIHAHIVVGKSDGTAHGGHLMKGIVHPTLEIILTESPAYLNRKMDEDSGIPLIEIYIIIYPMNSFLRSKELYGFNHSSVKFASFTSCEFVPMYTLKSPAS